MSKSKWAEPSDEERMKAFMNKLGTADVKPAYYRAGGIGEEARMESGDEYRGVPNLR